MMVLLTKIQHLSCSILMILCLFYESAMGMTIQFIVIEYSLMAYVILQGKKMFRLHFHFARNQTENRQCKKQTMGCRPG